MIKVRFEGKAKTVAQPVVVWQNTVFFYVQEEM